MGTRFKQGFTIIETMLVLAVTGVLIATLLVGVGSSINAQRYKDSVSSFKNLLQGEYSMVNDVTNDHPDHQAEVCGAGAVASVNVAGVDPGQSDCLLMGRYVSVVNDTITEASVLGYQKTTTVEPDDLTDLTQNYDLGISTDSIETSTLEWGAQIAWPTPGPVNAPSIDYIPTAQTLVPSPPGRAIGILFIRSPLSGTTYTFTSNQALDLSQADAGSGGQLSTDLLSMIITNPGNSSLNRGEEQRFICIDPSPGSTGLTVPEKLSVLINQGAGSASAIEQRSDSINTTLKEPSTCN